MMRLRLVPTETKVNFLGLRWIAGGASVALRGRLADHCWRRSA
jgi:hypothetical protein